MELFRDKELWLYDIAISNLLLSFINCPFIPVNFLSGYHTILIFYYMLFHF